MFLNMIATNQISSNIPIIIRAFFQQSEFYISASTKVMLASDDFHKRKDFVNPMSLIKPYAAGK